MKARVKSLTGMRGYVLISLLILSGCLAMANSDPGDLPERIAPSEDPGANESYWMLSIGGEGRDYAPSFHETGDGYVVVGMTSSYGFGNKGGNRGGSHDFMALKLDKQGALLWSTVVGGPRDERGSYSVRPTADGGFLLTGTTLSFGAGKSDLFIVELRADGGLDWSMAIGGMGDERGMTTLETEDGYITMGSTNSFGAGGHDLLVVKLTPDRTLEWAKTYGGVKDDVGSGIARVDGGYTIGGTIWSFGAGDADSGLIKIDPQGSVIWAETIGGARSEGINWDGVRVTRDGGYVIGDKTASFGAKGDGALFGVRLDPEGNPVWGTMVDGPREDVGWTMTETKDGCIAGGKLTLPERGGDVFVVKFDGEGNLLWSRVFGAPGLDEIEEIKPTGGGYFMAGITRMVDSAGDFLVAKVNTEGFVGGEGDPVLPLDPRSVVSITPRVQAFTPQVTDVSAMISAESVMPAVASPSIRITEIHRSE